VAELNGGFVWEVMGTPFLAAKRYVGQRFEYAIGDSLKTDLLEICCTYILFVGTPAYHPGYPLCIQFTIPGDRREST
jgi:hypothetical protein